MKTIGKYSKYLIWLGITLCVAGIVVGLISGNWSLQPLSLLVVGITAIIFYFIFSDRQKNSFWQERSTGTGTNVFLAILSGLIIIGLINFLALRHYFRFDLTETNLFTLAPQTQAIVRNLQQPLKVWIFDREQNLEAKELLENYARYNNKFSFEFVDPEINLAQADRFKVKSLGEVYLEYDKKQQLVQTLKLGENLSEIELTNAIEKIKREGAQNIYILQGHGELSLLEEEGGLSSVVNALKDKGYVVQPLNLAQLGIIPENADAILIVGPKKALFAAEVKALNNYLDAGGKILLLLAPNTNPGLETMFNDWGIKLDNRFVIDGSGTGNFLGLGPATPVVSNYGDHPITKDFSNDISVYPQSRPIKIIKVAGIEATPLVVTNEQTWGESNIKSDKATFDGTQDIRGPLDIGVALTRNREKNSSRMVIFGSASFISNGWFEQQINSDVFLNSMQWLTSNKQITLSIRPKQQQNRRINLTPLTAGILFWLGLIVIPFLGLGAAAFTWWQRR